MAFIRKLLLFLSAILFGLNINPLLNVSSYGHFKKACCRCCNRFTHDHPSFGCCSPITDVEMAIKTRVGFELDRLLPQFLESANDIESQMQPEWYLHSMMTLLNESGDAALEPFYVGFQNSITEEELPKKIALAITMISVYKDYCSFLNAEPFLRDQGISDEDLAEFYGGSN